MRDLFPTSRSELLAMFASYALVGILAAMVLMPERVAQLLIGGWNGKDYSDAEGVVGQVVGRAA